MPKATPQEQEAPQQTDAAQDQEGGLDLGPVAISIATQLGVSDDLVRMSQEQADAVNLLAVQGIITKVNANTLRGRVAERVAYMVRV